MPAVNPTQNLAIQGPDDCRVTRAMPGMHHERQHAQDGSAQSRLAVMEAGSMRGDLLQGYWAIGAVSRQTLSSSY
ncbi:MAG: hypothetical protein FRX49_07424 [Trebouxia sp. A1-2]|nr:MAG: hypothetical protein FRX49_11374 [Trebouxia sp. A1-2]KAA6422563.1 MAG: hypothetical protein FRX49_07424 [Trebouxia sp. A1-2]